MSCARSSPVTRRGRHGSPCLRRLTFPPPTLLLRRMEIQMLSLLGELRAGGDWARIAAEHWADQPPQTPLGRQDADFFHRRGN